MAFRAAERRLLSQPMKHSKRQPSGTKLGANPEIPLLAHVLNERLCNLFSRHIFAKECNELALWIEEIGDDGVVHKVVLVLPRLAMVHPVHSRCCIRLRMGWELFRRCLCKYVLVQCE